MKYVDDGSPDDTMHIEGVSWNRNPIRTGEKCEIRVSGRLKKPIGKGDIVQVNYKKGIVKLLTKQFDLLSTLEGMLVTPPAEGRFETTFTVDVPQDLPIGKKIDVEVTAWTAEDERIFRVKFREI